MRIPKWNEMAERDNSSEEKVVHKVLDGILVAQTRIHGKVSNLPDVFAKLDSIAGENSFGLPIVVHHWGVNDEKGHDMDVCLPLKKEIQRNGIVAATLPVKDAMTLIHRGPYSEIGNAYTKVSRHTNERGHPIAESTREVFLHFDANHPEDTVVEIQVILHDWTHRFSTKLENVLSSEAKEEILAPMRSLDIDSPSEARHKALCESLSILEHKTTDEQQYEILSHCAHVFPVELIPPMRDLFRSTGNVDAVIEAMVSKGGYYPKLLRREGSIIYSEKGPANPTAYKEAKTDAERRRAYCFCPLIRDCIDDTPEIFCNCSAGWPKQLWEGVLERPLKIEVVQSLTKGDNTCEFAIHLPAEIS
jgi:effector-binding domain-containing protein